MVRTKRTARSQRLGCRGPGMVRSTSLVCCLISASVFASSAAAQGLPTTGDNPLYNVWNALGRHGGVGWSDGYHRCPPPGPASWDQGMQYAGPPAIAQPCPNCWQPQPMLMDPSAYATPELAPTYAPTWQPPSNPYAFPMVSPPDQRADFTTPQIIRPEATDVRDRR